MPHYRAGCRATVCRSKWIEGGSGLLLVKREPLRTLPLCAIRPWIELPILKSPQARELQGRGIGLPGPAAKAVPASAKVAASVKAVFLLYVFRGIKVFRDRWINICKDNEDWREPNGYSLLSIESRTGTNEVLKNQKLAQNCVRLEKVPILHLLV